MTSYSRKTLLYATISWLPKLFNYIRDLLWQKDVLTACNAMYATHSSYQTIRCQPRSPQSQANTSFHALIFELNIHLPHVTLKKQIPYLWLQVTLNLSFSVTYRPVSNTDILNSV
jgi:hypothetical protein